MRQLTAAAPSTGGTAPEPFRSRRLFIGGLAIGVIVMSVVGLATAVFIESPREVAARSAPPAPTPMTAVVRWQVLSRLITVQGTVWSPRPVRVVTTAPFSTVTLTKMPVKPGDVVRPARVIAEVDGRPIILLRGRFPAYRNLHEGDHGADVAQL